MARPSSIVIVSLGLTVAVGYGVASSRPAYAEEESASEHSGSDDDTRAGAREDADASGAAESKLDASPQDDADPKTSAESAPLKPEAADASVSKQDPGLLRAAAAVPLQPAASPTADSAPEAATLSTPERELAVAKTDLDNLLRRVTAAKEVAGRLGLGPQTASAERSWHNADTFFRHQEYLSTIRELNNYLNQTQVPELKNYLKAQYMLGHAYEELSYKAKALKAYSRYLSTFLTAKEPDHAELIDVLRRIIPLASSAGGEAKQLHELLASITSMDLPKDVEPVVLFYAAKAAANSGAGELASTWFASAKDAPNDPVLRAKSLYMQALMALSNQDNAAAEDLFAEVIQVDKEGATRDLARLALARLSVHLRRRDTALKYYALISEDSPSFKEALFESVYVHLDLKQDSKARSKAVLYLARWGDGAEALQLRMLLAYLDMRAGDLNSAQTSIAAADKRLHNIDTWIRRHLGDKSAINQSTLIDLNSLAGGQLPLSSSVRQATLLFARLAELARRLGDIRGGIRNTVYTIGRTQLAQLRPFWVNRAEQLAVLGDALLQIGHRLSATETQLYLDRLSPVDQQRLQASVARRLRLLSPAAAKHRQVANWAAFAKAADLTRSLAAIDTKLTTARAEIATARYLQARIAPAAAAGDEAQDQADVSTASVRGEDGTESSGDAALRVPADARVNRLAELTDKVTKLSDIRAKALEQLRKIRTADLLAQSPHRATAKFIAQYATALHDEALVLAKVRDNAQLTAQKLNAADGAAAWAEWEFIAADLFRHLTELDRDIKAELNTTLAELDVQEETYEDLQARLGTITRDLEGRLGESLSYIIDQYVNASNARFARHEKWQGDIAWLTYQSKLNEDQHLQDKHALEEQILRDNLTDLQEGVLWQWPK